MQGIETERQRKREVTYQLALKGMDGIVLASDQCERLSSVNKSEVKNLVRKIWIDQTARFAWAYSGGEAGPIFSARFLQRLKDLGSDFSEAATLSAFEASAKATVTEYAPFAKGPWPCCITLACGPSKKIMRHKLSLFAEEMLGGWCVSGQEFNLAAFIPQRFYSKKMLVGELAGLAAYSIRAAHDLDSGVVDGLDIAIYRDSTQRFEFLDSDLYWDEAGKLDGEIRGILNRHAPI